MSFLRNLIPQRLINLFWHLPKAILANLVYGFPSRKLTIIGITGTSGKTTTAHLIYYFLHKAGFKTALISTISARIGNQEIDTGLHVTNPEPFLLQKLLKQVADKNYKYVVLEVTSHGLDQYRTWGTNFTYAVLTNITHEHLDYHKTFTHYQNTKLKLIKLASIAVLNKDDKSYTVAKKASSGKIISYSSKSKFSLPSTLQGDFNQVNLSAAVAVVKDLNLKNKQINQALKTFPGLPGRMEFIQTKPFTIIIDFAHKPDALEKALKSIKKIKGKKARIISVFGSAGLRDKQKRPLMGKISGKLSNITILTAEDPRTEDVNQIIEEIYQGCLKAKAENVHKIPDRQQAINLAIKLAKPDDIVALFGKAHEKSMCFGKIEHPWSEHQAVNQALKLKIK